MDIAVNPDGTLHSDFELLKFEGSTETVFSKDRWFFKIEQIVTFGPL